MNFKLDSRAVPDGTVLLFGIRYVEPDQEGMVPATPGKIWTYAMLKAGGLWYVTGTGRVPVAAGWGAVERWLERDGRQVVSVDVATGRTRLWPDLVDTSQS